MSARGPLTRIVLASASPRRFELLGSLGLQIDVVASGYGEHDPPGLPPAALAELHAREKLRAVAAGRPPHTAIVAADTVVDLDGTSLGKPADAADATRMLRLLAGRSHIVHTAFALQLPEVAGWVEERVSTEVRFFALSDDDVAEYVATGEPFDKAGGYGIQGRAAALVDAIAGDFYTVMGFPLGRFIRAVRRSGFSLPAAKNPSNRQ
ncbi:MAG: septum formation protein Maf [Candidatus Eremiobacteraeota bacterium]|nr:septum formation protein Maf [Candidatus Eremiobacteraeota bacterium]